MAGFPLATPIRQVATALAVAGGLTTAHVASAEAAPRQGLSGAVRAGDGSETYRGYRIEMAPEVPNAEIDRLFRAAEHQVDMVEATRLDAGAKDFLRRFPVVVRPGSGEGSHYAGGDSVTIAVDDPEDRRPILLHEYMHVYHFRKLPGGRDNPDILTFFERARTRGLYPAGSYVLKNQGEFFAMTASVYLHGRLAREPFTRDELRRKQPVYDRYLGRLFGARDRAAAERPSRMPGLQPGDER